MITEDLIKYIKNQVSKNVSKEVIISELTRVGWRAEDIDEGMSKVIIPSKPETDSISKTEVKKEAIENQQKTEGYIVDPYHEPIGSNLQEQEPELKIKPEISKIEDKIENEIPPKIWTPSVIKPILKKIDQKEDIKIPESKTNEIKLEEVSIKPVSTETIEVFQDELKSPSPKEKPSIKQTISHIKAKEEKEIELIPTLISKQINKNKIEIPHKISQPISPASQRVETIIKPKEKIKIETEDLNTKDNISKIAMMSSYSKDYLSAGKLKKKISNKKKSNFLKTFFVILIVFILGAVILFFTKTNRLKIDISSLFIKKNPKVILMNSARNFRLLKSYKVKTEIDFSSPLLADITSSLENNAATYSNDKDWFLLDWNGLVSKRNINSSSIASYDLNLKSSLLKESIITSIDFKNEDLFIKVPNLKFALGNKAPLVGIVSIKNNQLDQLKTLLPSNIQQKISNLKLSKIFPNNFLDYLNGPIPIFFNNFVSNMNFTKEAEETISGVKTYHYSISLSQLSLKNFLDNILNIISPNISKVDKTNLDRIFKATSVKSFDVWIGKKDENIYQYKFVLNIPLSKIFGLEDKSLINKKVTLSWQTTYSDLNIPNNIIFPTNYINFNDFMRNMKDLSLRNTIYSFSSSANEMKNTIGNYGKKSNKTGSCIEPTKGSLFSPTNQPKGSGDAVKAITNILNSIITQTTDGTPLCYSTPTTWAIASPRIIDSNYYFCADSTGVSTILTKPITGALCK